MEPKFQSSFIPKGPIAGAGAAGIPKIRKDKSLLSFISGTVFTISICLAVLTFGYKIYLGYRINSMSTELEADRAQLAPDTIREITRLNDRIIYTDKLVANHRIVSPLLDFLESSTLKVVRFNEFSYDDTPKGINVKMLGQSQGYAALALQADMFAKSSYFNDTVFSDLHLNDVGNVTFSVNTALNKDLVSYKKSIERTGISVVVPQATLATTTATTTAQSALSTGKTSTSTKASTTTH